MTLPDKSLLYKRLPGEIRYFVTLLVAASLAFTITLVMRGYHYQGFVLLGLVPLMFTLGLVVGTVLAVVEWLLFSEFKFFSKSKGVTSIVIAGIAGAAIGTWAGLSWTPVHV